MIKPSLDFAPVSLNVVHYVLCRKIGDDFSFGVSTRSKSDFDAIQDNRNHGVSFLYAERAMLAYVADNVRLCFNEQFSDCVGVYVYCRETIDACQLSSERKAVYEEFIRYMEQTKTDRI